MPGCSAAWYELNLSAPDNIVSACCYYAGEKDEWADTPRDIRAYWNSPAMQRIREVNSDNPPPGPNGCSTCFLFDNKLSDFQYFDFANVPADLSAVQRVNWVLAAEDYALGRMEARALPLKLFANFGFLCNLACTMCHQVPRRATLQRQVRAESILAWRDALQAMLEVTVIGGEPFALREGVAFIRGFIADDAFDPVRLTICTNGTVHHKHMDTLRRKRKLSLTVSLDSMQEGYERIRVNGHWDQVERNVLSFLEMSRNDRPEWTLQNNVVVTKTGIPFLPAFARWHARHGIPATFYDFINSRGTEDAYFSENVLHNPHILADMPDWEEHFHEAVATFRAANLSGAADTLDLYRTRVASSVSAMRDRLQGGIAWQSRNTWQEVRRIDGPAAFNDAFFYSPAQGQTKPNFTVEDGVTRFARNVPNDHVFTDFLRVDAGEEGGAFRLTLGWPKLSKRARRAHVTLQRDDFHELSASRQIRDHAAGIEEVVVGEIAPGVHRFRLLGQPTGEDESVMPERYALELDGAELVAETTPLAVDAHEVGFPPVPEEISLDGEQAPRLLALAGRALLARRLRGIGRRLFG